MVSSLGSGMIRYLMDVIVDPSKAHYVYEYKEYDIIFKLASKKCVCCVYDIYKIYIYMLKNSSKLEKHFK